MLWYGSGSSRSRCWSSRSCPRAETSKAACRHKTWSGSGGAPTAGCLESTRTVPAIVQLVECRNADPRYWEGVAYSTGLHIAAALRLALWNKQATADVREHLWIVVERDAPRLVARRRAAPELLEEGRVRLAELMSVYARCLKAGTWPSFEPGGDTTLEAWAPVTIQPWMTNGAGPHGGYFAPTAVPLGTDKAALNEEAA